jgi:hypothetical protein
LFRALLVYWYWNSRGSNEAKYVKVDLKQNRNHVHVSGRVRGWVRKHTVSSDV